MTPVSRNPVPSGYVVKQESGLWCWKCLKTGERGGPYEYKVSAETGAQNHWFDSGKSESKPFVSENQPNIEDKEPNQ